MATWMTHFRIADLYIDELESFGINIPIFIFSNIAPDCGVLNADRLSYTPDTETSHFGKKRNWNNYKIRYLSNKTDMDKFSFYLGYYLHLLCDEAWFSDIGEQNFQKYSHLFNDKADALWTFKRDWYDLDKLFIKKHPAFRAFNIFSDIENFSNNYFDFFPCDAFDKQLNRIRDFYLTPAEGLDREYIYLTENDLDTFINEKAQAFKNEILGIVST